ncbi:MAG: DUF5110 domain-containing protein [Prevotellaceae bacterium]|nr:DUF5110 domain-containing protein [Prevotellaceae bacterium]
MKRATALAILAASATLCLAQGTGLSAADPAGQYRCEVQFYTPSIVRIVKYPSSLGQMPAKQSFSVVAQPEASVKLRFSEDEGEAVAASPVLSVSFDKLSGNLSFSSKDGNLLLTEAGAELEQRQEGADKGAWRVKQSFAIPPDEALYGLGQLQNGLMSQRGFSKYLIQDNTEDFVPLLQSVKGYGIFWDNASPTTYTDGEGQTSFDSEVGDCIDYYFIYGGNADAVVAGMRHLTGQVPMLPLWTYGYWQSKERYKTQRELVDVVRQYRELGVPLDGIIQDWQYWGNNYLWNAMDFLNPDYPEPQRMVDEIHSLGAHTIISVWASFGPHTKPYLDLERQGLLLSFRTWPPSGLEAWPPRMDYPSGVRVYDAFSPTARDIYWDYMNRGLFSLGIDGWWLDSTEPDHVDFSQGDLEGSTSLGSLRKVRNAFPLVSVGGVYDHQRATSADKRVVILTRSAFAGQQRYGADTWSGDVTSSWETLRRQIPAGLNFSLTGIPQWNTDIGGFFAGEYNREPYASAPLNPLYQELYVRWLQFGAFTPMMRSHGTDAPREIYRFGKRGEPVFDAIAEAIRLRYSLLPYIYSTSWEVSKRQSTFMRALVMDFPHDSLVWEMGDEYMFGKSLLVAPIVRAQYTPEDADSTSLAPSPRFTEERETTVYLPSQALWYDFWTCEPLLGGQSVTRKTTLDRIPLFVRAGSILPLGPDVQYATEKPWDELELRLYPGADGAFTLYEDAFDGYAYEQGQYTEIPISWRDHSRTLLIGERKGGFEGMIGERTFNVVLPDGTSRQVTYKGKPLSLKL